MGESRCRRIPWERPQLGAGRQGKAGSGMKPVADVRSAAEALVGDRGSSAAEHQRRSLRDSDRCNGDYGENLFVANPRILAK
ncbi:hypothetical protein EJB05_07709, partial [Eragrostis curvula]